MVGRPPPEYVEYNPIKNLKNKSAKKKDDDDKGLDEQKAELEEERELLLKRAEIRGIKKESFDLKHHRYTAGKERAGKARDRLARFAGGVLSEGIRATRPRSVRRGGVRRKPSMAYPGVYHPVSTDISLSKAIAMNNWSGNNTGIMERDFFGGDNQDRELLGDRNKEINLTGNVHQQFFGEKKNMDLIDSTTKDVSMGNGKKKKAVEYY